MNRESLSRRGVLRRLFGAAALSVSAGRSACVASGEELPETAPPEDVIYYRYDKFGRLISIGECSASRKEDGASDQIAVD